MENIENIENTENIKNMENSQPKESMPPKGHRPRGPKGLGPKGPRGPRGPRGPMVPTLGEDDRFIMPDFKKWRDVFFHLDCFMIALCLCLEVFVFILIHHHAEPAVSPLRFFLYYLVVPSGINLFFLLVAITLRKKLPQDNGEMRQNFLPIILMLLIGLNVSICHYMQPVVLSIYFIPIFMTTMFSEKSICQLGSRISIVGACIATVRHILHVGTTAERLEVFFISFVMIFTLVISTKVALALLGMTSGQRQKMYEYAASIREAQHKAEAASYAKSAFLANMSHEIRTPINAILGMNEMILRESKNDQITEYAENVYSASTALLHLVNDVLDISKIESGKLEIVENSYDTSSFIHDCCTVVADRIDQKHLTFDIYCNPDLPSQLWGDEIHLRQIITNFLSNAAKYTEKGSVSLRVDKKEEGGVFSLVVTVKDTGMGIKPEDIENLFSQFTRFDMNKNRNIEGTGLGLSIAKQLVDLMQGEINVESEYGKGSTFSVTIPQKVMDATPMGDFHERYQIASQNNVHYRRKFEAPDARILVVDDVEVNLKVAANLLKQTKILVDTAGSGKLALEKMAQHAYDIVFMDHMMPEMNGIETYQTMKTMENSLNLETPVVMLTANAITGVKENYLEIGFSDYLSKPIIGEKFEDMILKYLPEEKVQFCEDTDADEQTDAAEDIESKLIKLQAMYQMYPRINILHGLSHCGHNPDIYVSFLFVTCNKIEPDPLEVLFKKKDLKQYEILVHDMRRAALDAGFTSLKEKADDLEQAAGRADWDTIEQHHAAFVEECHIIINAVKQTLDRRKG